MNNNIQESYCSYQVAKLLKEKGFDVQVLTSYRYIPKWMKDEAGIFKDRIALYITQVAFPTMVIDTANSGTKNSKLIEQDNKVVLCSAPTHALAIEWLRVNFGIWIAAYQIEPDFWNVNTCTGTECLYSTGKHPTPHEATEAALLYTLQNLI